MKKLVLGAVVTFGVSFFASAQIADVTACQLTGHPKDYDGKMVRVKGRVQVGFDSFLMVGESCSSSLWLSYPAGTKAKSGPATTVTMQLAANSAGTPGVARPAVTLERNKDFETFDSLLSQKAKTPGMCLGCVKNDVQATLVGRFDGTEDPGITRDKDGKILKLDGFGNMNAFGARLVIQSISEVSAAELDFSQAPKVKDDSPGGNDKNYMGLTKKAEEAYPKGSPAIGEIDRAIAALGAPGVDNGVTIVFGGANEVPAGEGAKGARSSPDGLLLTVAFDPDKLKGDALSRAVGHQGSVVASLRATDGKSYSAMEQVAWQTTLEVAMGARQKSLTLPGGAVLFSEGWPEAERGQNMSAALTSYLTGHEQAPR